MKFCFYYGPDAQRIHTGTLTPQPCEGVNLSRDHVHVSKATADKLIETGRAVLRDGLLLQTSEETAAYSREMPA